MDSTADNAHPHNHWVAPGMSIEPTIQLSPSIHSSTNVQAGSLSVDQASNAWGSWTDLDLFDFGANAHEPSWLVGGTFDIDALNSSISAIGSPWGYSDAPANLTQSQANEPSNGAHSTDDSTSSNNIRNIVRSRWHTRPAVEATYPYAPTRQENQDRVDEAYRAGLSHRLRPCLHDDVLPSADFLVCSGEIRLVYPNRIMIVQADSAIEYMHQVILCQISAHLSHRPRAFVSTLIGECPSTLVYLLAGGSFRGICRRCCSR